MASKPTDPLAVTMNPQLTGNVGLYYCCYHLSRMGWNVMPTARNAKGVDIIAYSEDATRLIGIQVKSLSKRAPVPLGTSLEKIMGHFWVIINRLATDAPRVYILEPNEVRERASESQKDGKSSFWLQPPDYEDFEGSWHRIGSGSASKSPVQTG